VSTNPFRADPGIGQRMDMLEADKGEAVRAAAKDATPVAKTDPAKNLGSVLSRKGVETICRDHGVALEELMLLILPLAQSLSRPPISRFHVGAVGLERETGNLILGCNLEFPGTHLANTVHGEGFVVTRAVSRGTSIEKIAIGEAHPCAHCRQYLAEFAGSRDLLLIDPLGHRLNLAQLYPWPFDPQYLGQSGLVPGTALHGQLALPSQALPVETADALLAGARRAYAPYSGSPGVVVLTLHDGTQVSGVSIESVAFNPTMSPLQSALIDLCAHGCAATDIGSATLATTVGGAVDYSRSTAELLSAVAPQARLDVIPWAA
jgi:cytidine deaminase